MTRRWRVKTFVIVSLLMAWSESTCLTDRFDAARVAMRGRGMGRTYQGWVKASRRWSPRLLGLIGPWWRQTVCRIAGRWWKTHGWVPLGVDGTKLNLPRTDDNERTFGVSGKKHGGPQAYLCTILHLATGLPWCWRIGGAMASERDLLRRMIRHLPAHGLLIADAGFVGYPLWRQLDEAGHAFVIRAGANVRLLRGLGYAVKEYDGIVYLWPKQHRKKMPPMILRLIEVRDGDKSMCLLTNVLDHGKLSDAQAAMFYGWRWGIELWFRGMKQTLAKRELRSKAPKQAVLELRWAVLAMGLMGLMGVKAQVESGGDPKRLSFAGVLRVVRRLVRQPQKRCRPRQLTQMLAKAVKDRYARKRPKASRGWPRKKNDSPPGHPEITESTEAQRQAVQRFCLANAAA